MDSVRCKFKCDSVTKSAAQWDKENPRRYTARFTPVSGFDAPENEVFGKMTPSGSLEITTIRDLDLIPGEVYYVDIKPVKKD